MHPFSSRPSLSATIGIITALDLVSLLVTLPFSYFMRLGIDNTGNLQCQEGWESTPKLVFGNFTMLCQFVIPFTTIIFCYGKIMVRLRQRSAAGKPGTRSKDKRLAEEARTRRTNRMLIAMVIIFAISWFPINLINLLADCIELDCWPLYYMMFFLSHVIAMSSTCYNPLLYGWLNSAFSPEVIPPALGMAGVQLVGIKQHQDVSPLMPKEGNPEKATEEAILRAPASQRQNSQKALCQTAVDV